VIDRHNPDAIDSIKKLTEGELLYAIDVIGSVTASLCVQALSLSKPAYLAHVAGAPAIPVSGNITSKAVAIGTNYKNNLQFFKNVVQTLQSYIDSKKLLPNKVHLMPNGLTDVVHGLKLLAANKISAEKLVVTV